LERPATACIAHNWLFRRREERLVSEHPTSPHFHHEQSDRPVRFALSVRLALLRNGKKGPEF
jgi:hypothetical protein